MRYQVRYDDGSSIEVELPGMHEPAIRVIEKANSERRRSGFTSNNSAPTQIATIAQGADGEPIGIDRVIWTGPRSGAPEMLQPGTIRLFISFAYGFDAIGYGNVLADMEYEPHTHEHIAGLQQNIESQGIENVTILQWQIVPVR